VTSSAARTTELVVGGSVRHASRLITQIENGVPAARGVLAGLLPHCGSAQRIGITGPPGAGKSSLTAALIKELRAQGRTVGVIAVDPSSPFSRGALLGDRDRMLEAASGDAGVFIRSLASRGAAGGLAAAVNDVVDVMDAMGKDVVIVETVGVGQGELEIAKIAHTVVLVFVPGYGDALQAMKAGITEIADVVAVNKGDLPEASRAVDELRGQEYVRGDPTAARTWVVPVQKVSALRYEGIAELTALVDAHYRFTGESGWRAEIERHRRHAQFVDFVAGRLRAELAAITPDAFGDGRLCDPYAAAEEFVTDVVRARAQLRAVGRAAN
jgi:LAO/AO transport system kinase